MIMPTLEERVAALETAVAAIQDVDEYELGKAGETIDAILNGIEHAAIHHGRDTITVTVSSGSIAESVSLSLGFSAKSTTKVVASVRKDDAPTPYNNVILTLHRFNNAVIASITAGYNESGGTTRALPTGTYYIDWICFDEGE
jgi:hypothetical protein